MKKPFTLRFTVPAAAFLFFLLTNTLLAALPPEAQEALDKGVIAAKQQDYLLAVRFFQDARKIAPDAPEIFYNLGLAESKIPGRELRAMAWFGAYLAATTNALNATAVKELIQTLEVKSQSNLAHLIESAEKSATINHGYSVAKLWAESGDYGRAKASADMIQDKDVKNDVLSDIAIVQAEMGDVAGAKTTFNLRSSETARDVYLMKKIDLFSAIADAEIKSGDNASALNSIATAKECYINYEPNINNYTKDEEVRLSLRAHYLVPITKLLAEAGDISNARKTAGEIKDASARMKALESIATAELKSGDEASASATLETAKNLIVNPSFQQSYMSVMMYFLKSTIAEAKRPIGVFVSNWLGILDYDLSKPMFLDLPQYLKTRSDSDGLSQAAWAVIDVQNKVEKMLKQQAKQ